MLVLKVAGAAAAAIAGTLAVGTSRNMLQTNALLRQPPPQPTTTVPTLPLTLGELQVLPRHEVLQVYLHHCQEPTSLYALDGDWHGVLLQNNALTRVSRFITNRLFGKGRRWNGKRFDVESLEGINRFEVFSQQKDQSDKGKVTVSLKTENDHAFDLGISPSPLFTKVNDKKSFVLNYTQRQGRFSLWHTMADELRVLPCNEGPYEILVGLGSMGWSGGALNCSPFCLYRLRNKRTR